MARIRKLRLNWRNSLSPYVSTYKLYWEVGGRVSYASISVQVGKRNEITLPDDVPSFPFVNGLVEFGVTAVTKNGNESDMTTLMTSLQFAAPDAPIELMSEPLLDFWESSDPPERTSKSDPAGG